MTPAMVGLGYKVGRMLNLKWVLLVSKDCRLPVQLQRAMAAEAEAAREARAKVLLFILLIIVMVNWSCP